MRRKKRLLPAIPVTPVDRDLYHFARNSGATLDVFGNLPRATRRALALEIPELLDPDFDDEPTAFAANLED